MCERERAFLQLLNSEDDEEIADDVVDVVGEVGEVVIGE